MTTWTESELAEVDRLSQTLPLNEAWSIVANDKIAKLEAGSRMSMNNPAFAEVSDRAYTNGYEFGKFEAIEDCAQVVEDWGYTQFTLKIVAAAIRALKDKP